MRAAIATFLRSRRTFAAYCAIGVLGVTIDYATFYGLVNGMGVQYLLANALSTSLGITNNFIFNACFNFKVQDRLWRRFVAFYGVGLLGLAVSSAMLYVLVSVWQFSPDFSKLATLTVVVGLQYNLNRLVSFRK